MSSMKRTGLIHSATTTKNFYSYLRTEISEKLLYFYLKTEISKKIFYILSKQKFQHTLERIKITRI